MTLFVYLGLLTISFALIVGVSLQSLVMGFLLSLLVIRLLPQLPAADGLPIPRITDGRRMMLYMRNIVLFILDFLWDLTVSNIQIAWDVWTPKDYYTPIFVHVQVGDLTDLQLALLASRITLTPGTLSADVSADRRFLIVHTMYPGGGDVAARLRRPIEMLQRGLQP